MPETVLSIDLQRIGQFDDLVRENRVLIALSFPVIGALSLAVGFTPLLDWRTTATLLALTLYAYGIEYTSAGVCLPQSQP